VNRYKIKNKKRRKMKEKLIAGFMAALTTLFTAISPVLAATALGDFPTFLGVDGTPDFYVVVGASAATADVVGAIDVATRLAELSYTVTTVSGVAAEYTGVMKDTIDLPSSSSGTLLSASGGFPASAVLKTFHYSGLEDSTFTWRSTSYDYHEQVDVANVKLRHGLDVTDVNGTEKMVLASGNLIYQYVFDETLTGTGSTTDPNYSYPINVKLLGKDFSIVGTSASNQVTVLQGSIGTATATTPVVYGDYSVYSDLGSNGAWARINIKDSGGSTVDQIIIDQGSSEDSTAAGLTIKVTAIRALTDGTIVGVDVVVGPTGTVEKTYDTSADTTSTGTGTAGTITAGDTLEVVYQPSSTVYKIAGEKVSLPNNYGDLGFEGWNTVDFATITVKVLGSTISAYNNTTDTQSIPNLDGIEISTDVSGSILSPVGNAYDKAYVLFNKSIDTESWPVLIGYYDSAKAKVIVGGVPNDVSNDGDGAHLYNPTEYVYAILNHTTPVDKLSYAFKLNYGSVGEQDFYLNVTIDPSDNGIFTQVKAGKAPATKLSMHFENKTVWKIDQAPSFRLGATATTAEDREVNITSEGASANAGKKSQEVVNDDGLLLQNAASGGASDKVVFKIPAKDLKIKAYFGEKGAEAGEATTYNKIKSITSSVSVLDSEVTSVHKAKNIVTVGGPCANTITAELANAGKLLDKDGVQLTCTNWNALTRQFGIISAIDDGLTTGKVALVVAGSTRDETRTASSALQNSAIKLAGVTAGTVEVSTTGVVTVV